MYPNPYNNQINIVLPNSYSENTIYVQLLDITSRVVYNKRLSVNSQKIQVNDLSKYSDGSYFIFLLDENQRLIQKKHLIKKSN